MSFKLLHSLALYTFLNFLDAVGKQKLDLMVHSFSLSTDFGSSLGRFWSRARTVSLSALLCAPLAGFAWEDCTAHMLDSFLLGSLKF